MYSTKRRKQLGKHGLWVFSRHPALKLRQPKATSQARKEGFNNEDVHHFFDLWERTAEAHDIDATRIYNVDEAVLSTVHKPPKVIAKKDAKQAGATAGGERGVEMLLQCCWNLPPPILFKRERKKNG